MEETVIWEQHTVTLHRVGTLSLTDPTASLASLSFSFPTVLIHVA